MPVVQTVVDNAVESSPLWQRYQSIRAHSEQLADPLSTEDCALQAAPFVSPIKWHLAHTSWFFETFILLNAEFNPMAYEPFHPQFQLLFNSYYNGVGKQFARPQRHLLSRPSLPQVMEYRQYVDEAMAKLLSQGDLAHEFFALLELGLNHEQQHQELMLMDLKYCFFHNPLYPAYQTQLPAQSNSSPLRPLLYQHYDSALYDIGAQLDQQDGFAFDNESPRHQQYLTAFAVSDRLISNGEYFEFILDGGYEQPLLWLSDGWAWLQQQGIKHPLYWLEQNQQWYEFTLYGLEPMDIHRPVSHISYYEADAFSQWAGARLARESEWEVDAQTRKLSFAEQSTGLHCNDAYTLSNQVWQWSQSPYQAYPGYRAAKGAVGEYNGKFMANQMVLRGGSALTPSAHGRTSYRNFFYPQDRWPMTGIRLAHDV